MIGISPRCFSLRSSWGIICFTAIFVLMQLSSMSDTAHTPYAGLEIVMQWKLFSYNFPAEAPVQDPNYYNPLNVAATCMTVSQDRVFIATPKLFAGVPATVSFVPKAGPRQGPLLQAYPDWSYTTSGRRNINCRDALLVSVYRLRIDSCNRLWVLDAGISRSFEDSEQTCPPKLMVFDLNTDELVKRIDFPANVLRNQSLLTNLIIDETTSKSGKCDDVFVYISDTTKPAIIVYDSARDLVWRVSHPAMWPDPDFAELEILNDRFVVMDGVIGLAFDKTSGILYFQPLATDRVFSVHKDVLRAGPLRQHQLLNVQFVGRKSSQGLALYVVPQDGSLVFSPFSETVIASWQPYTNKQRVLAYDMESLQFVAELTDSQTEPNIIYALSSRFQRFLLRTVNPNEFNIRLLRIKYPSGHELPTTTLTPGYFRDATHNKVNLSGRLQQLQLPHDFANTTDFVSSSRLLPSQNYAYRLVGTNAATTTGRYHYQVEVKTENEGYHYGVGQSGI